MEGMVKMIDLNFYKDKKVFITGHTGFKGSWMCQVLSMQGADIMGYALEAPTKPNLFEILNMSQRMNSIDGDVRDLNKLKYYVKKFQPDIMIHMAAQPIVRNSYRDPVYTYETNVMGTINFLEAVRECNNVKSVINVTTDKVYENKEWEWGYRENDRLNGYDPYSNSKSCSELVTSSYINSFFRNSNVAISTCRAGNVIGGGDFATDRIIPDCIRFALKKENIIVRNPFSIRPYQHVLEPIIAYLKLAQKQYGDIQYAGNYNIGPDECDCITTGKLVTLFCDIWGKIEWNNISEENALHEANFLKLDCSKIKKILKWNPLWHIETAIEKTIEWVKGYYCGDNINEIMEKQINSYIRSGI